MSEHNRTLQDPCEEVEIGSGATLGTGQTPVPDPPGLEFDPPIFPTVETEFEGVPLSRECLLIPRNLYYDISARAYRHLPRTADEATDPSLITIGNLSNIDLIDPFRYVSGKVFNFSHKDNENYIYNEKHANQQAGSKCDFVFLSHQVVDGPEDLGYIENSQHIKSELHTIRFGKQQAEIRFDIDVDYQRQMGMVLPLQLTEVEDFYKKNFKISQDVPRNTNLYKDNTFKAPAAFFYKEADGLNIPLPEMVSMQVFIPESNVFNPDQEQLDEYFSNLEELSPISQKVSLYERYSIEYEERESFCPPPGERSRVQKFPAQQVQLLNDITKVVTSDTESPFSSFNRLFKNEYRYYTKFSFNTKHESPIASKLKELQLDSLLLGILDMESPDKDEIYTQIIGERIEAFEGVTDNDGESLNTRPNSYEYPFSEFSFYIEPHNIHSKYDLLKLALDPATYPLSYLGEEIYLHQRDTVNRAGGHGILPYSMMINILQTQFGEWVNTHTSNKRRRFSNIIKNELSYSEVIAYRLEKRDPLTGEVLQNFYFFNDPETDQIDFIDTQVTLGARYKYSLYTINYVEGLRYRYSLQDEESFIGNSQWGTNFFANFLDLKFKVDHMPAPYIIDAPYHEQELLVLDAPPLPPDYRFLPWETLSENLVFLYFTPTLGQTSEKPIPILESDFEVIEKMKLSQNVSSLENAEILYKSDSDPIEYEFLVLKEPPLSYQDFSQARTGSATINSPYRVLSVEPNQDYYFCFRAKDRAGVSNPSAVTKFRLESYGDGIRHVQEEYYFEEQTQDYLLSFGGVIQVAASMEQSSVNFTNTQRYSTENPEEMLETTRGTEGLSLGLDPDDPIWDQTFIFEITSATTGRAVQIEATFRALVQNYGESIVGMQSIASGELQDSECLEQNRNDIQVANSNKSNELITRTNQGAIIADPANRPNRSVRVRTNPVTPSGQQGEGEY